MQLYQRLPSVLVIFVVTACTAPSSPPTPKIFGLVPATGERCDFVSDTLLAVGQSVEGLEGRYRIILVKTDGVRKPNGVFPGWLALWRTSPNDSTAEGRRPSRNDRNSIYFGTIDIDIDAAELYPEFRWKRIAEPMRADVDPIHPPVLAALIKGVANGQAWQLFWLKIGTASNSRETG
jgi:hypothetical protein